MQSSLLFLLFAILNERDQAPCNQGEWAKKQISQGKHHKIDLRIQFES
jgi:hypothetical protein